MQRAQSVSVPLPRTPEQPVPALETLFQPVPHGNVAPETPQLSVPTTPPFQCFPGEETAPVTACGKLEICSACIILSSFHPRCSRILLLRTHTRIPLLHTITFERNLMRNQQLTRSPMIHSRFDDPPVPAPVILCMTIVNHTRTQLQSRIRKPAQNLEPDAKRLRWDVGKRAVLMLSHDVSFGSECCKPVRIFNSCGSSGDCADVFLTRRAANKKVQYDALVKSQQERVNVAMTREWDKWNEFGVTKFLSAERHHEAKPRSENRGNQKGVHGEGHPGQARLQG